MDPNFVHEAQGDELCSYLIALEGWRRGLKLTWHAAGSEPFRSIKTWYDERPGKLFSLSDGDNEHFYFRSRGDAVTDSAVETGMDKEKTKTVLQTAGVPVPKGIVLDLTKSQEELQKSVEALSFPLVIKPLDGSFGKDVFTRIESWDHFFRVIDQISETANTYMCEEFVFGSEYRLYVVGNEVVSAIKRVPASVEGDGKLTVARLIEQKNTDRKQHPRLKNCLITIDDEIQEVLDKKGLSLKTVLPDGEALSLRSKSNISLGGEAVDCLDELSGEMKKTAVNAAHAVDGFAHGGVDMITEDHQNGAEAVVIEMNPTAQIGSSVFPSYGRGRDVPAKIVDYYFPKTRKMKEQENYMYFIYKDGLIPLETGVARKAEAPDVPRGFKGVELKVKNLTNKMTNIYYFKQQMMKKGIVGYLRSADGGKHGEMVVMSTPEKLSEWLDEIKETDYLFEIERVDVTHNTKHLYHTFDISGYVTNWKGVLREQTAAARKNKILNMMTSVYQLKSKIKIKRMFIKEETDA
ncbi:ATP-grasp domain-containing protein [Salisediminibacterium halotolerans]|uniref:ATP-grasp domain-containing protein n=1 Tax=Salisediminibacterium halotolerans TaxID=517425 RepID=UPI0015A54F25|nr:ATP-grasp domain-containing protein [Salisediminibacterium haloalkalitolerans]